MPKTTNLRKAVIRTESAVYLTFISDLNEHKGLPWFSIIHIIALEKYIVQR